MIVKLKVNLETLTGTSEDPEVSINEIKLIDGELIIEVSKPDLEIQYNTVAAQTWQQ